MRSKSVMVIRTQMMQGKSELEVIQKQQGGAYCSSNKCDLSHVRQYNMIPEAERDSGVR